MYVSTLTRDGYWTSVSLRWSNYQAQRSTYRKWSLGEGRRNITLSKVRDDLTLIKWQKMCREELVRNEVKLSINQAYGKPEMKRKQNCRSPTRPEMLYSGHVRNLLKLNFTPGGCVRINIKLRLIYKNIPLHWTLVTAHIFYFLRPIYDLLTTRAKYMRTHMHQNVDITLMVIRKWSCIPVICTVEDRDPYMSVV